MRMLKILYRWEYRKIALEEHWSNHSSVKNSTYFMISQNRCFDIKNHLDFVISQI